MVGQRVVGSAHRSAPTCAAGQPHRRLSACRFVCPGFSGAGHLNSDHSFGSVRLVFALRSRTACPHTSRSWLTRANSGLLSRANCEADLHSSFSTAAVEAEFQGGSNDVPDHAWWIHYQRRHFRHGDDRAVQRGHRIGFDPRRSGQRDDLVHGGQRNAERLGPVGGRRQQRDGDLLALGDDAGGIAGRAPGAHIRARGASGRGRIARDHGVRSDGERCDGVAADNAVGDADQRSLLSHQCGDRRRRRCLRREQIYRHGGGISLGPVHADLEARRPLARDNDGQKAGRGGAEKPREVRPCGSCSP